MGPVYIIIIIIHNTRYTGTFYSYCIGNRVDHYSSGSVLVIAYCCCCSLCYYDYCMYDSPSDGPKVTGSKRFGEANPWGFVVLPISEIPANWVKGGDRCDGCCSSYITFFSSRLLGGTFEMHPWPNLTGNVHTNKGISIYIYIYIITS